LKVLKEWWDWQATLLELPEFHARLVTTTAWPSWGNPFSILTKMYRSEKKEIGEPLFSSCPNSTPVGWLPHHGRLGGILFPFSLLLLKHSFLHSHTMNSGEKGKTWRLNEMKNTYPLKRLGSQMVESTWWKLREIWVLKHKKELQLVKCSNCTMLWLYCLPDKSRKLNCYEVSNYRRCKTKLLYEEWEITRKNKNGERNFFVAKIESKARGRVKRGQISKLYCDRFFNFYFLNIYERVKPLAFHS
jgi:Pyruvate/2-oxoacid:ferredoxin oxidoreductase delta subunit